MLLGDQVLISYLKKRNSSLKNWLSTRKKLNILLLLL